MPTKGKGIEIVRQPPDKGAIISQGSIEIRRQGKPISGSIFGEGYVYLVIDCSTSMQGNKLEQAKKGAMSFAKDALVKGYLTGLIQFHTFAKLICEPQKDVVILDRCLKAITIGDTTHMAKAIRLAHNLLKGIPGTRVIVIVTDGMPNGPGDPKSSLDMAEDAKKSGIDIIAIGTDDADQEFLKRLASRKDLGVKVQSKHLEKTISDSAKLLPTGHRDVAKR